MDMKNREEIIDFALWMFNRQTIDEQTEKVSISRNSIGFNSPDAQALTNLLICLDEKVPYSNQELNKIAFNFLKPRLIKYESQYNEYINSQTTGR
jgi:hypothetical protein